MKVTLMAFEVKFNLSQMDCTVLSIIEISDLTKQKEFLKNRSSRKSDIILQKKI